MRQSHRQTANILGVKVDYLTEAEGLRRVAAWLKENQKRYIVTPNPEMVVLAQKDKEFLRALNQADMALADGIGLRLADRKLRQVRGTDFMLQLIKQAALKGWRVMLVGGRNRTAERAAKQLKIQDSKLKILGESGPAYLETASQLEKNQLLKKINQFKPDFLFVGFGQVKQEKWIKENLARLKVKVAMGVGGGLDYILKPWKRAPILIQNLGLEWLWRLFLEPWRIKRQLNLLKFVYLVYFS